MSWLKNRSPWKGERKPLHKVMPSISAASAFRLFLFVSMGILTAYIILVIGIAMHQDLTHIQATEGDRQLQSFSNAIRLYAENHVAALKDHARLPFATQAVMHPEANRPNIADFLEERMLLGFRPQIGFLDYEGTLICASRESPAISCLTPEAIQAFAERSLTEYTAIQKDGDNHFSYYAIPINYQDSVEGFLVAAIPLEEMMQQTGLHQQDEGLLEVYQNEHLLTACGNTNLTGAAQELLSVPFGLRLVYRNEFADTVIARTRYIFYLMGTILLFSIVFGSIASVWGRNLLVEPLECIRLAANRIADRGTVDISNLKNSEIKEIQQLSHDFERMMVQLHERQMESEMARENLENQVRKQTISLQESQQRYALVLEGTRAGLWDWNIQTGATIFDEQWAAICGYTLEELQPISIKTWLDLAHPEDLQKSNALLDRHFSGEIPFYESECRMKHKDGHWIWVHDRGKVVSWDEENSPLRMTGTHLDVTLRKQAEAELLRQTKLKNMLMDISATYINLPLGEIQDTLNSSLLDMGEFVKADRAYIFEYNFEADTCSNTLEWCRAGVSPQIDELQAVPLSEVPDWVETHRRGGCIYYPDVSALPLGPLRDILESQAIKGLLSIPLMNQSECLGFVGFDSVRQHPTFSQEERNILTLFAQMLTNLHLRQKGEAELVEATERANAMTRRAQDAARAKSMFLANMSHEIRTPLNAILGYAQILRRTWANSDRETVHKEMECIINCGNHLLELINDVLELSRIENSPPELSYCNFDFHAVLNEVHQIFLQKVGLENLSIKLEVSAGAPRFLSSDRRKIRQILINLIGNAVKFTPSGWIRISAFATENVPSEISICIADSGLGIPAHQLERIFTIFEQTEDGQSRGDGTGMGLTISRQYAQSLGGNITVSSKEGHGSEFLFTFKAKTEASASEMVERKVVSLAPNQPVRRLLLVEDDINNIAMLTAMLGSLGFEIQTARNGLQALDILLLDTSFDAVLLDMKMPELDGAETLRRLRGIPGMETLPVLVLTASGLPGGVAPLREQGVDSFVQKPVHEAFILNEIQRLAGVQYIYEDPCENRQRQSPDALRQKVTDELPAAVIDALRNELKCGHVHGLHTIIEQQASAHPELADQLKDLVENYEYESLGKILGQRSHI